MTKMNDDFLKRLLETFRIEADEHIKEITSGLLELEKASSAEDQMTILEAVYRAAHSLKGAARSVDMKDVGTICQSIESIFADLKNKNKDPSAEMFDVILNAVDTVSDLISFPEEDRESQVLEIVKQLDSAQSSNTTTPDKGGQVGAEAKYNKEEKSGTEVLKDKTRNKPKKQKRKTPAKSTEQVRIEDWTREDRIPGPEMEEKTEISKADSSGKTIPYTEKKSTMTETVRISIAKLDSILLQAEEMISAKQSVAQYSIEIQEIAAFLDSWKAEWGKVQPDVRHLQKKKTSATTAGEAKIPAYDSRANRTGTVQISKLLKFFDWEDNQVKLMGERLLALNKVIKLDYQSLNSMINNLLEETKKVLMLPFSTLLEVFPKMVRDIARDQGKDIELILQGGNIDIDKRILEEIKDPLIHLVRNSIDHGIEKSESKSQKKKISDGTITVSVSQSSGNKVEITVSDNGSGINLKKLRETAVKHGIVSEDKAVRLNDDEVLQLIFQSGISTSRIITDLSGRGLGLAIVREKVEKLGGLVTVNSESQNGTTFRLVLPVTISTFRGILVRVSDHLFILPTANVERVVGTRPGDIRTVENRETISINGRSISFVRLDDMLGLQQSEKNTNGKNIITTLVCIASGKRVAFSVDEVLNEQEVIIKGLGRQLLHVRNISGATILGSGKLVPILDVADLMKSAARDTASPARTTEDGEAVGEERKSILVVEDSFTSRTLLKNILGSAGYHVKTAVDGLDGFTTLNTEDFDLVVSDVEMPRMNGFELVSKIRSNEKFEETPVILVTSLDSREDREKGIDVGANAYIVKKSFDQSNLLEVVKRLI